VWLLIVVVRDGVPCAGALLALIACGVLAGDAVGGVSGGVLLGVLAVVGVVVVVCGGAWGIGGVLPIILVVVVVCSGVGGGGVLVMSIYFIGIIYYGLLILKMSNIHTCSSHCSAFMHSAIDDLQ
jgi:hypothetical protein